MGSADRLTRLTVVEKAVEIADAHGLEAVTIRRLAQELGVTPMALYWHFKNKDQLLEGIADYVLAEVVTPAADPSASWSERLRAMGEALVGVLRRHRALTSIFGMISQNEVESNLSMVEASIDLLCEAGFALDEAYLISSQLFSGAVALVDGQPGGHPAGLTPEEGAEWRRRVALSLQSLPSDRFPRLIAFGRSFAGEVDLDRYYTLGLDLLVSGVEAIAAKRAPSTATPKSTR